MSDAGNRFESNRHEAEVARFYQHANLPVDYADWARSAYWTGEQAVALSFGLDPDEIIWDRLAEQATLSPLAHQILRGLKRVKHSQNFGELPNNMPPHKFVEYLEFRKLAAPIQLFEAIKEFGRPIPDWRQRCSELQTLLIEAQQAAIGTEGTLAQCERANANQTCIDRGQTLVEIETIAGLKKRINSLQIMCLGMALHKYGLKSDGKPSSAATNIVKALATRGLSLSVDTVRDHLHEALAVNPIDSSGNVT